VKLTPGIADAIVSAVRRGVPPGTACKALGIYDRNMTDWLDAPITGMWRSGDPVAPETMAFLTEFRERIEQAQAEFECELVKNISDAGFTVGKSGVPEWRAHAWLANNHPAYRSRFRQERFPVGSDGAISHHHTHTLIRTLPDDLVARALDALPDANET
jgi:hypothetical protein